MTAKEIKNALTKDYIEALGIFANYLKDSEDAEETLYELDSEVWTIAEENHLTDEWLEIYTGLMTAL